MASPADSTAQEPKTNREVKNETADKAVKDEETIITESKDQTPVNDSSPTNASTMPEGNEADETAKLKARFRKGNMFIDAQQANSYFNKKK